MNVIDQVVTDCYAIYNGDCVNVTRGLPDNSKDYIIYSPPFASLYTYSASDRDMGNSRSAGDFARHYAYLVRELYRVLKPGRLLSFHCMQLPATIQHDGYIGLKDFRGELIRIHQEAGFIFHSEVCIWKDPVTAMQRTKAIGLLHKQLCKDSAISRQGIPDYLVTMRKPGRNEEPVCNADDPSYRFPIGSYIGTEPPAEREYIYAPDPSVAYSIACWQRYASPVWMDISPTRTLQYTSAKESDDQKHICPLQLDVIERALHLWTNPGDIVLTPFAGIGSEAVSAVKMGRRAIGIELKGSYYHLAARHLANVSDEQQRATLFDLIAEPEGVAV